MINPKAMWNSLDATGKTVLVVCATVLIGLGLYLGVNLEWLPRLFVGG